MPKVKLSKLILQNFKSIPFASVDFSGLTFIVGRNGTGKSNLADAFAFLSEAMEQPLQSVINRRGGPSSISHKEPRRVHDPATRTREREVRMGLAVEFSELPSYGVDRRGISQARYAVEIVTRMGTYFVSREQCSVTMAGGERTWFERGPDGIRSNLDFLRNIGSSLVTPKNLLMQVFGGVMQFSAVASAMKSMAVYSIEPTALREFQDHDPGSRLLPDGSNSASVLKLIAERDEGAFQRLIEILSSIIPDLGDIRSVSVGRKQVLRFWQSWDSPEFGRERLMFDAFNMSDGTLRSFGILLAVFQRPRPSLILIEEPETSIHPGATGAILELLRSVSAETQVIVTTHSPEVLDYASSDDVIRVVSWSRGSTRVDGVYGAAKAALQQHLSTPGELFRMRILDAPSLFGGPVIPEPLFEVLT